MLKIVSGPVPSIVSVLLIETFAENAYSPALTRIVSPAETDDEETASGSPGKSPPSPTVQVDADAADTERRKAQSVRKTTALLTGFLNVSLFFFSFVSGLLKPAEEWDLIIFLPP